MGCLQNSSLLNGKMYCHMTQPRTELCLSWPDPLVGCPRFEDCSKQTKRKPPVPRSSPLSPPNDLSSPPRARSKAPLAAGLRALLPTRGLLPVQEVGAGGGVAPRTCEKRKSELFLNGIRELPKMVAVSFCFPNASKGSTF